jgi:hypothetical protein
VSDLAVPGVAYARVNWGRWLADCPAPYCRSALELQPGEQGMICWDCGAACDVVWPADTALITELLAARPDPITRNWEPAEPINHLLVENLAHGIGHASTPELGAAASRLVLDASGDEVRLRLLDEPLIIDACPARAIGGQ